jgi:hypothetical protein
MTPKLLSLSAISGEEGAGAADNCANEGTVAEDGDAMTEASEGVEALDDTSVKGFGTLYFFPSFANIASSWALYLVRIFPTLPILDGS